jgi:hypothetical protein
VGEYFTIYDGWLCLIYVVSNIYCYNKYLNRKITKINK